MNNGDLRIIDMTESQLSAFMDNKFEAFMERITEKLQPDAEKKFVYGIAGLASLFNVSLSTANRIKRSGLIDSAIVQYGHNIVIDAEKALKAFSKDGRKQG